MRRRWAWAFLGVGLVLRGGTWWLGHHGTPSVQAGPRQSFAAASSVVRTTALGSPTGSLPATCCGGTTTPTAAARTASVRYHATSISGQSVSWPSAGVTVLYFMSAQCGSCIQGEQQLAALEATLPATVHLVSLDVTPQTDTRSMLSAVAHQVGAHWPQAFATPALLTAYHVVALDQVAVVNAHGQVVYDGALPFNTQLRQMIRQAGA